MTEVCESGLEKGHTHNLIMNIINNKHIIFYLYSNVEDILGCQFIVQLLRNSNMNSVSFRYQSEGIQLV